MRVRKDPWRVLQGEVLGALTTYPKSSQEELLVYVLLPYSIAVLIPGKKTFLHLRRTEFSNESLFSKIGITSNKLEGELVVSVHPEEAYALDSGQVFSVHDFCVWLFDLALDLSDSVSVLDDDSFWRTGNLTTEAV